MVNKKYLTSFITVAGGTLLSQIITFLASPAISRLYSPTAFGYFSTYSATISILAVISCARYELAIPLPKDIKQSIGIFRLAFFISLIIALVSIPVILVSYFLFDLEARFVYILYPLVIILNALGLCLNLLHNKVGNYGHSSLSKILQAIIVTIISLSISTMSQSYGLIISSFFGQLINIIYLLVLLSPQIKKSLFEPIFNRSELFDILKNYIELPKLSLLPAFLNIFSSQIPNYLVSALYGAAFAGFYFFSLRLVVLPMSLIGSSINEIFYQKIIEKKNNGEKIYSFFKNNLIFLSFTGGIFFLAIYFFSQRLIPLFFGAAWINSVIVCKILALSMFIKLIVSPLTMTFIALNRVRLSAIWQYSYFSGIILICSLIFYLKVSFIHALFIIVGFDLFAYCIALIFIFSIVKSYDSSLIK
jgi:lipopolysaccharide exporter